MRKVFLFNIHGRIYLYMTWLYVLYLQLTITISWPPSSPSTPLLSLRLLFLRHDVMYLTFLSKGSHPLRFQRISTGFSYTCQAFVLSFYWREHVQQLKWSSTYSCSGMPCESESMVLSSGLLFLQCKSMIKSSPLSANMKKNWLTRVHVLVVQQQRVHVSVLSCCTHFADRVVRDRHHGVVCCVDLYVLLRSILPFIWNAFEEKRSLCTLDPFFTDLSRLRWWSWKNLSCTQLFLFIVLLMRVFLLLLLQVLSHTSHNGNGRVLFSCLVLFPWLVLS